MKQLDHGPTDVNGGNLVLFLESPTLQLLGALLELLRFSLYTEGS